VGGNYLMARLNQIHDVFGRGPAVADLVGNVPPFPFSRDGVSTKSQYDFHAFP
jgi:hypothetical protein